MASRMQVEELIHIDSILSISYLEALSVLRLLQKIVQRHIATEGPAELQTTFPLTRRNTSRRGGGVAFHGLFCAGKEPR